MTKEELEAFLRTLDIWVILFGAFVAIGVTGEFIVGFMHFRKGSQLQQLQAAENLTQQAEIERLRSESASIRSDTAKAIERAAHAELQAAESNRIAEGERLARVRIEERMADRRLTPEQQRAITARLKSFSGQLVNLVAYASDGEIICSYSGWLVRRAIYRTRRWKVSTRNTDRNQTRCGRSK